MRGDVSAHAFGVGLKLTLFECMAFGRAILLAWIPHCIALLVFTKLKQRSSTRPNHVKGDRASRLQSGASGARETRTIPKTN